MQRSADRCGLVSLVLSHNLRGHAMIVPLKQPMLSCATEGARAINGQSDKAAAKREQSSSESKARGEQSDSKQMARKATASKAIASKATTSETIARSDDVTTVTTNNVRSQHAPGARLVHVFTSVLRWHRRATSTKLFVRQLKDAAKVTHTKMALVRRGWALLSALHDLDKRGLWHARCALDR